jgi:hypothetical protein
MFSTYSPVLRISHNSASSSRIYCAISDVISCYRRTMSTKQAPKGANSKAPGIPRPSSRYGSPDFGVSVYKAEV